MNRAVNMADQSEFPSDMLEKLTLAAELYYVYHLHQKDVAAQLGISRSWVSKLLKRAEEMGIVRIDVTTSSAGVSEVEKQLIHRFGIKNAKVVRSADRSQTLQQCARAAAHYLISVLKPDDYIGIGWGTTLSALFDQFFPVEFPNTTVIPLVGGVGTDADCLSNQLAANLANALHGKYRLLHTPALVAGKRERELIMLDPYTREAINKTEHVDIAILAMGALSPSKVWLQGETVSAEQLQELKDMDVVGDVVLNLMDSFGRLIHHPINDKVVLGDLRETRKNARHVIGFALGEHKVPIIHAALVGGWIDALITDLDTANALLAF